jgi:hypothetical protein
VLESIAPRVTETVTHVTFIQTAGTNLKNKGKTMASETLKSIGGVKLKAGQSYDMTACERCRVVTISNKAGDILMAAHLPADTDFASCSVTLDDGTTLYLKPQGKL